MRRRTSFRPGWLPAAVYAVALHAILIALLVVGFRIVSRPVETTAMQATVVRDPAPDIERARQQEDQERKAAQTKKDEEQKKHEEAIRQAQQESERKKQEEERKREEERKNQEQDQERRKKEEAEKKKQADAEKRKREEEQKQQQAERRKQAEEALREQLAEEEKSREQARNAAKAARAARMAPEVDKYKAAIRQKVERNWIRPASSRKGLQCTVHVRQAPGGEVLEAKVVRSSGDSIYDRSVENAVYKASPLPTPPNAELFDRDIEFIFRPED